MEENTNPMRNVQICGQREIADHLMLYPNQDRTRLLKEQTENLEEWLYQDKKTEPELAYWIPKYTYE